MNSTDKKELTLYNNRLVKILEKHKKTYKIGRDVSLATVGSSYLELGDYKKAEDILLRVLRHHHEKRIII